MATDTTKTVVKTRLRTNLPQAGFDSTGASKNVKQQVVAVVTNTDVDSGLLPLAPKLLGLVTIDTITAEVSAINAGAVPAVGAGAVAIANYDYSGQQFVITRPDTGAQFQADSGSVELRVTAVGDSAMDPGLVA